MMMTDHRRPRTTERPRALTVPSHIAFHAMGTSWWIGSDEPKLLPEAEALVRSLESKLSRFAATSALSRLNKKRSVVSRTLAAVAARAAALRESTGGAFDPTLGKRMRLLGYDRSFERVATRPPRRLESVAPPMHGPTAIVIDGERVSLEGPGDLDLGGIGKGWAVDRVLDHLVRRGAGVSLVDGGGDIRGHGACFAVGVGEGLMVPSEAGAVATSSTLERRWRSPHGAVRHHLLDPRSGRPAHTTLDTATVIAPDAATADALATALVVDPSGVMPRLGAHRAHALVRSDAHAAADGSGSLPAANALRWWTTPAAPVHATCPPACRQQAPSGWGEA